MELSSDLISQIAKATTATDDSKNANTVRGTVHVVDGRNYIHLDGAAENQLTPVETTVELNEGDRVVAISKDHSIIVTGNGTNPSVGTVTASNLQSTIERTAGAITTRVETLEDDNIQFSQFQQTVNGFSFMGNGGEVKISGGDLNLTGSITWSDLSPGTKDAISNIADEAIPSYITSTKIDGAHIESSTIIGGTFHAVGSDPNLKSTFTTVDEDGLHLYSYATVADMDGTVYPKITLQCGKDKYVSPSILLGSGEPDSSPTANRLEIHKGADTSYIRHHGSSSNDGCGIEFDPKVVGTVNGTVTIDGELRGTTGLFPIGYIYLSFDSTNPRNLFGGYWQQLTSTFLYATSDLSTIGTVSKVVISASGEGVTSNEANCVSIGAWRRVG